MNTPEPSFLAPYGFVPLSLYVATVPWPLDRVHDLPFADGVSGTLEIDACAHTPLFTRDPVEPQRSLGVPGGKPMLAGSGLRGMLRSVLEIASFSRLGRFNEHRFGIRDLRDRENYGKHMSDVQGGSTSPLSLVSAGWLYPGNDDDTPARIQPCHYAKIHYDKLQHVATERRVRNFKPGEKQSAPNKYRTWGDASLQVNVETETLVHTNPTHTAPRIGTFGKVVRLDGSRQGTLVFTGQPSNWTPARPGAPKTGANKAKQNDFVFLEPAGRPVPVDKHTWEAFLFVHSDSGQQHGITAAHNEELRHWWKRAGWDKPNPKPIPVFFLLHPDGRVRALGLAMMFRLAADHSTRQAIENVQGKAATDEADLARAIFGDVDLGQRTDTKAGLRGLKGRVSVGDATLTGGFEELPVVRAPLSSPRASYYPAYLEQGPPGTVGERPEFNRTHKPVYRTWMSDKPRARGWKRYRQMRQVVTNIHLPTDRQGRVLEQVLTRFQPIRPAPEARFRFRVQVHNLRPIELGALLWSLDFGGHATARHGFGMAKSLGYGALTLEIRNHDLTTLASSQVDLSAARAAFAAFMEGRLPVLQKDGGWQRSRQLAELLALATPGDPVWHPILREGDNPFKTAKDNGLVLRPEVDLATWRRGLLAQRPPEPPITARSPDDLDRQALTAAMQAGTGPVLLLAWKQEAGEREAARKRIAREVYGKPSKKMQEKHGALIAWWTSQ
jgi:CRISPR-associated protein (TIGR03986 family)